MTVTEDWIDRWQKGRTGWHEKDGNEGLKKHWSGLHARGRVLVPLCGKTPDLMWLAEQEFEVVGVELSEIAIKAFFEEHTIEFKVATGGALDRYTAVDIPVTLYCGDYFNFTESNFDALYDRGSLVALSGGLRRRYVEHTKQLLRSDAVKLLITLEYDQSLAKGPPYSVMPDELLTYWDDLVRMQETDDLANCPPKFRAAGITEISEVVWRSPPRSSGNTSG